MKVFITGGTGFIGHYVVKALLAKGHEVVVATRHPNKVPSMKDQPGVSFVECSLTDFEKMAEGMDGCDGCSQPDRRFFSMAQAVKEGRDINIIKNDGTQFIHASQQAELYLKVLESDCNEEIFLGLGASWIGWKEIAEMMISLKPGTKSKIVETDLGWSDQPTMFDVSKIKDQFGLLFEAREFMKDHVKWTFEKV